MDWAKRSNSLATQITSLLDFLLWGFVKDNVYRRRVSNIDDLKARITTPIASVEVDMLVSSWRENTIDLIFSVQ